VPTAAPRVLVADDEDDIRAVGGLAVRRAGCTVAAEVPDGAQALAAGADAHLAEPFSVAGLLARVRELTAGVTA
jgi:CheY-like chemotaxis protein